MIRAASRLFVGVGLLALAIGGAAGTARADFVIEISSGAYSQAIEDNGVFDTNPDAGQISVDTTLLNQDLAVHNTGFRVTQGLGASTNAQAGGGFDLATLSINGEIQRTNAKQGNATITFLTRSSVTPPPDYGYGFPNGGAFALDSSTGGTFLIRSAGDQTTFRSLFTDANSNSTSSSTLVIPAAASYSADSPEVWLGFRPHPFDLTSILSLTLNKKNDKAQFTGITSVRSVPEPGSIALLALGGLGLVAAGRRRRRSA